MYFLGTLEKILEGTPKVEPEIVVEKKEYAKKPYVKGEYKKTYDKPYVKSEYKKPYEKDGKFKNNYDKPYVKKEDFSPAKQNISENSHEEKASKKKPTNCYGVYVRDGDTFEAMYNQQRVCFRLAGIDCPETNQPFSQAATEFLKSKVLRKVVYVEIKGEDIYKRQIVEAYEDKEMKVSINKQLLQEGLATSERYRNSEGELTHNIIEHIGNKISEVGATLSDKGMWSDSPQAKIEPIKVVPDNSEEAIIAPPAPIKRKFPK